MFEHPFRDLTGITKDIPQSLLILTVDDEPISRRTLAIALGKANLRCVGLDDSRLALTILKENQFDLIFLDAEMPGMNGFELCTELRKLPSNKTTPVIFVTSMTNFEIRAQSSLSGGNDLIAKPFLMMELAVKALTYLLKPFCQPRGKSQDGPIITGGGSRDRQNCSAAPTSNLRARQDRKMGQGRPLQPFADNSMTETALHKPALQSDLPT